MTRSEYVKTSEILQHLFRTSAFVGIDFGSGPNHHLLYFKRAGLESWLSIEGFWQVQASRQHFDEHEQLQHLIHLRREHVVDVQLAEEHPHIELTFESGAILYVNGYHDQYESWQAGDARPLGGEHYLVVAMPEGDLAIFVEEGV